MTFLEAYNFMSESEDNACLRSSGDEYKVMGGNLYYAIGQFWQNVNVPISSLNKSTWSKVEKKKVPETMELTFYVRKGEPRHTTTGKWFNSYSHPGVENWRKTDQTRTVTFVEGEDG